MANVPWARSHPKPSGMAGTSVANAVPKGTGPEPAKRKSTLPPPGPSNIIVLTPNPWPPPKDVRSQ